MSRGACPTVGFEVFDPVARLGPRTLDGCRLLASRARAIVYVVQQVRWVRVATAFGEIEDTETDRQLAFETGVTVAGSRLWAGGGGCVRQNDYPLDAVPQVRDGVRW